MAVSRSSDRVGQVLGGRFRLLAPIGTGASASVYVAEDVVLRRRVAVKVLHDALADDEAFLRRFRAEAHAAAALNHPHLVAIYDWGQDAAALGGPTVTGDGIPYLVTEYLAGGSLRGVLDTGGPLSPAQALLVGLEAARGLEYAHRRGFVHRDIKPANLLFDEEGRLRIADFGLARALAEAAWTEPLGAVLGTAKYASPEQARGESLDGKSDVYSLALVIVEAVTGTVPFAADTTIGTLMARVQKPLVVPESLGALRQPLEWAGVPDPAQRPDAAELGAALMAAASGFDRPAPLALPAAPTDADLRAGLYDRTAIPGVDPDPSVLAAGAGTAGSPAPAEGSFLLAGPAWDPAHDRDTAGTTPPTATTPAPTTSGVAGLAAGVTAAGLAAGAAAAGAAGLATGAGGAGVGAADSAAAAAAATAAGAGGVAGVGTGVGAGVGAAGNGVVGGGAGETGGAGAAGGAGGDGAAPTDEIEAPRKRRRLGRLLPLTVGPDSDSFPPEAVAGAGDAASDDTLDEAGATTAVVAGGGLDGAEDGEAEGGAAPRWGAARARTDDAPGPGDEEEPTVVVEAVGGSPSGLEDTIVAGALGAAVAGNGAAGRGAGVVVDPAGRAAGPAGPSPYDTVTATFPEVTAPVRPGADPYGADPDGRPAPGPAGGDPYGRDGYGGAAGDGPYGRSGGAPHRDPYRPDPYGPDPYGPDPYGPDPYGPDPYGPDPYGSGYGEPSREGWDDDGWDQYGPQTKREVRSARRIAEAEAKADRLVYKAEQRELRPRRWPWVVTVLAVVLLGVGAFAGWWFLVRIPVHPMPNLVGKNVAELESVIGPYEWVVSQELRYDDGAPAGQILAQQPPPSTEVARGQTITVTVSKGLPPVDVPTTVVGKTRDEASRILTTAGLGVGAVEARFDEKVPNDVVIALAPNTPATVLKGTDIGLVVSKGPEPRTIPDNLVGAGGDDVVAGLEAMGLKVNRVEDFSDTQPAGKVIAVDPPTGQQVPKGGTVKVTVSKGPPTVAIPDVGGLSVEDATAKIEGAGLTVSGIEGSPKRKVQGTDPASGTTVRKGSAVKLVTQDTKDPADDKPTTTTTTTTTKPKP